MSDRIGPHAWAKGSDGLGWTNRFRRKWEVSDEENPDRSGRVAVENCKSGARIRAVLLISQWRIHLRVSLPPRVGI